MSNYTLLISCPDTMGLVSVVSTKITEHTGNISQASHHLDKEEDRFFMRITFCIKEDCYSDFKKSFEKMATKFKMKWVLNKTESKKRVLIMCSKLLHCVNELLYKYSDNNLHCNIVGILSNHTDASKIANYNNINFKHIPINQASKEEDIAKMSKAIDDFNPEVIVLARYMQIIPKEVCDKYKYKIINIHHSFLPSFIGANPYHRAYNRGVKLIGATCHYVTKELDSGPIIEQDVARITHSKSIKDIEKIGQDVEKIVLVTGLKYHLEDRNLICNNRTIVLT